MAKLLNNGNSKTSKGEKLGYITYGLHLAPAKLSGYNVCSSASKGCASACLNTAGRGKFEWFKRLALQKHKNSLPIKMVCMATSKRDWQRYKVVS